MNSTGATRAGSDAVIPPVTTLTEEERMFQRSVREFARGEVAPLVNEMDESQHFSEKLIAQCFALGLMGIEIPEEYGGAGGSFMMSVLAVEELARVDPAVAAVVDVQNTLVINPLRYWGTEKQKRQYLPRLAREWVGAYALSEPTSGSDAFALRAHAKDRGDHFVLNGRKLWVTNGSEASLFVVFATVDPEAGYRGITAFLIERDFPGFQVGHKENKLGIRASSTCELLLDNCRVPKENILGEMGKGYKVSIETLNEGRIGIGAQMTGLAQGALEAAIAYSKSREQFGKAIAEFQGIQFQLAEMAIKIEASRLLTYNAARLKMAGQPFLKEAAMAKWYSSEIAEQVASRAVEIYGGYGFTKDYPVEKFYRDAKIGRIYEGTSNIQLQTIAKLVIGK